MVNRKNFNATVYTGDRKDGYNGKVTYHSQRDLDRLKSLVSGKYPKWIRINLYDKKTNECETIERETKTKK